MNEKGSKGMGRSLPSWESTAGLGYGLALALVILYVNREFYHDDAYITLRYVRNFLNGAGIVWNPGEYVQGYTNFLHLMLISLFGWVGLDLVLASRIIGVAAFACLPVALLLYGEMADEQARRPLWHLAAILVLTAAPLIVWSLGGLEGTLFSLLVAAGCFLFLSGLQHAAPRWCIAASGCCFGLGFLTRPDGVVFIAVSGVWLAARLVKRPRTYPEILSFAVPLAVIAVPYVVWQLAYYGDFVPNTYYAKIGLPLGQRLRSGFSYVVDYAAHPPYLLPLAAASLLYALAKRVWNTQITYLGLSALAYLLFIVYAGGDHMQAFRFVLPLVALLSGIIPLCLTPLIDSGRRRAFEVLLVAILGLATLQLTSGKLNPRGEDLAARLGTIVGKYIAAEWPEGSLVALNTAGSTPYYADRHRFIDMLGLNDSHIAKREIDKIQLPWQYAPGHLKGDGAYVLSRKPDFIIAGPASGTAVTLMPLSQQWFLSDIELVRDRRFLDNYALYYVQLDDSGRPVAGDGPNLFKGSRRPFFLQPGAIVFVYYENKQRRGAVNSGAGSGAAEIGR